MREEEIGRGRKREEGKKSEESEGGNSEGLSRRHKALGGKRCRDGSHVQSVHPSLQGFDIFFGVESWTERQTPLSNIASAKAKTFSVSTSKNFRVQSSRLTAKLRVC